MFPFLKNLKDKNKKYKKSIRVVISDQSGIRNKQKNNIKHPFMLK